MERTPIAMPVRRLLVWAVAALLCLPALGQGNADCPGFRNPVNFNTGNPLYFWTARVGERTYTPGDHSDTTTGYHIMSTCVSAPDITGHANITAAALHSGSDYHTSQCGHTFFDANDSRFQIISATNAGIDQFTVGPQGGGMSRIAPGYTTSIRLGDMRSTGHAQTDPAYAQNGNRGAEALFYTMRVTPQNALLVINYAVVARRYSHDAYDAGEFLIRVVMQDSLGNWPNEPISDSLWYKVSAPNFNGNELPTGWLEGAGDIHNWPCTYAYKPWAKVGISLSRYMHQNVRIEMYTSDCIYNADPIYAYIAGDFRSMLIQSAGCADGVSQGVDSLYAPEGMISYQWFVAERGYEFDIFNARHMDTIPFRPVSPVSADNGYVAKFDDFILAAGPNAGDTIAEQTFLCVMTSALDPNKPVASKIYTNVQNNMPTPRAGMETDCALGATFTNHSIAYGDNYILTDSTCWVVFADTAGSAVLDTLWGGSASYRFPSDGFYRVDMHTRVAGSDCGSLLSLVCHARQPHPVPIGLAERDVCEGDSAWAWCTERCQLDKVWHIGGRRWPADSAAAPDTIGWLPPLGTTVVSLTTTTDSLCPATTTDTVRATGTTTLVAMAENTVVCRGDTVSLVASGIDRPRWLSSPEDSALAALQGSDSVRVAPSVTTTYSVRPSRPTRCLQSDADITIHVLDYPVPTLWTSTQALDHDAPWLRVEDRSPHGTSSLWSFSDGQTAEGSSVTHQFATFADSVGIGLHTCNRDLCCADTAVTLPVEISAIWFPNAFTPDQATNRRFVFSTSLSIVRFDLWVYNRNGLLVFHGTDFASGWDGCTADGTACPQGAYAYTYRYSEASHPDRDITGTGTVLLLR